MRLKCASISMFLTKCATVDRSDQLKDEYDERKAASEKAQQQYMFQMQKRKVWLCLCGCNWGEGVTCSVVGHECGEEAVHGAERGG